jgi:hypothetical protein
VLFARGRFGVSQGAATALTVAVGAAAIVGVVGAGRLADRRLEHGHINSRLTVAGSGYLLAALVFIPALLTTNLAIALPLIMVAAAAVTAPNSPGDAARLDVVPSRMWGRTESIRTFIRTILEAFAPLLFGFVSELFSNSTSGGFAEGVNNKAAHVSAAAASGLAYTFLIMMGPLAGAGLFVLIARRFYPTDVASAEASEREAFGERRGTRADERSARVLPPRLRRRR